MDFCGEYRREVNVLVGALRERVAVDLLASQDGLPPEVLLKRLTKRLVDHLAFAEDAARWAVESWSVALGVVSSAELVEIGDESYESHSREQEEGATTTLETRPGVPVAPDTVARAIEQLARARGRKAQERKGTVRYKRATIFYNGIEYLVEEMVHKKYQAAQDRKRCSAVQGGLVLFDWSCIGTATSGQGGAKIYVPGPWAAELIAVAAELDAE